MQHFQKPRLLTLLLVIGAVSFFVPPGSAATMTVCFCIPHDQNVNSSGQPATAAEYYEHGLGFTATDMISALQPSLAPFGIENLSPVGMFYVNPNGTPTTWKLDSISFSGNPTGTGKSLLSARNENGIAIVEREIDDSAQTIDFSNDPLWSSIRFLVWCANAIPCANGQDYTDKNVMTNLTFTGSDFVPPPPVPMPEPMTLTVFSIGVVGAVATRRRKNKTA